MNQPPKLCFKSKFTKNESPPLTNHPKFSQIYSEELPAVLKAKEEEEFISELEKIQKQVEDYMRNRCMSFEKKMFDKFYSMRIEQSRKFIGLIKKIDKSWDNFIQYLKSVGAQGDGEYSEYTVSNTTSHTTNSEFNNIE